jgi:hypothetical protein
MIPEFSNGRRVVTNHKTRQQFRSGGAGRIALHLVQISKLTGEDKQISHDKGHRAVKMSVLDWMIRWVGIQPMLLRSSLHRRSRFSKSGPSVRFSKSGPSPL